MLHFLIRPSLVETGFADFILRCIDMHPVLMQIPRISFVIVKFIPFGEKPTGEFLDKRFLCQG